MRGCRPLTNTEVERVLGAFAGRSAPRDRALFVLGLKAGFRVSELLSLRLGDILEAGGIARRVTVRRRHVKGGNQFQSGLSSNPHRRAPVRLWKLALFALEGAARKAERSRKEEWLRPWRY